MSDKQGDFRRNPKRLNLQHIYTQPIVVCQPFTVYTTNSWYVWLFTSKLIDYEMYNQRRILFSVAGCGCVLHVKSFILPVDIQHNQCPCRFSRYIQNCGHKTTPQRYYVVTYYIPGTWYAVSTVVGNPMPCHHTYCI